MPPSSLSNRNVTLGLAFTCLGAAARGVWAFSTLSNYLQGMTRSVFSVGLAEGVQGVSQALVALLAGWYADKFTRELVLKSAGVLGLLTIGFMFVVLYVPGWDFHDPGGPVWTWMDASVRYPMFVAALGFWGAYQGVWNTSLETIFADSIPLGERSSTTRGNSCFSCLPASVVQSAQFSSLSRRATTGGSTR